MRVRYTSATGCPAGQFIIEAENEQDRAILANFTSCEWPSQGWRFWRHSEVYHCGVGVTSFNFGYIKRSRLFLWFEKCAYRVDRIMYHFRKR